VGNLCGQWRIDPLFVTRMAEAIRSRELTLARARENEMRNEQLVAIGTLAAGTAHALGTPLSTMSVLLTDLDKYSEAELKTNAAQRRHKLVNDNRLCGVRILKQAHAILQIKPIKRSPINGTLQYVYGGDSRLYSQHTSPR